MSRYNNQNRGLVLRSILPGMRTIHTYGTVGIKAGHYRPASETPMAFRWRANNVPKVNTVWGGPVQRYKDYAL